MIVSSEISALDNVPSVATIAIAPSGALIVPIF
jgi:hypothetical protein